MKPGALRIYKSKGAAAFSLLPPRYKSDGIFDKQGCILVEAAPSSGKQQWDWQKKITFALNINDIAQLIDSYSDQANLFHKYNDSYKTLSLVEGEGKYQGTWMMYLTEKKDGEVNKIMVPLTNGEFKILMQLFMSAVPKMLGWE